MIIVQKAMDKSHLYNVDGFGVKNYNYGFIAIASFILFFTLNLTLGYITYQAELGLEASPIKNYTDAIWLMVMSSTTIGFGDIYPITFTGRASVFIMFILGIGILGGMGAVFANKIFGFADTNIKNRELRMQNSQIIAQNNEISRKLITLEEKLDTITKSLK
ncbi:potassium channel family protein [Colwellia sp. M166]|uniref:potassium channel family protein n=1 Tax=Colwellia sp. M166 TaxID=2583805 RepID=UPI00211EA38C|nr:potassium channel family protein [Colwellia sp. M166]|tara:strand:+ start:10808 stop:11293 length:486 start_codon:yes stop_codon:yes gene_type:complete